MSNNYLDAAIAQAYGQISKCGEVLLGYPSVIQALGLSPDVSKRLLDYGCGNGKITHAFCQAFARIEIVAVDESAAMIELAQAEHSHQRIKYQLIQDDVLPFLADHSCDGAFACFVFINVSTQERFLRILQEVHRVLKPQAPFVILDAHPDHLGKSFLDYQAGEVDTPYQPGESYRARLHIPEAPDLLVQNYYWPKDIYQKLFSTAGFSQVEIREPTLKHLSQKELLVFEDSSGLSQDLADWDAPPYMILRAVKHI